MPLTPALVGTPGAVAASAGNVVTPTTLTPATGTGYAVGDTLLCFTACSSATPTVATPAGWTSILNVTGTNGRLALFAKVAASTSEAAPSVVWSGLTTGTSGTPCQAIVAAFANLEDSVLASMADVVGASASGAASTATSVGGAAITTTLDKSLVLSLTTRLDDAFTTFTAPAGFTNVTAAQGTTSGADFAMGWAYQVKTPAGAVTAPSFGLTGASSFASTGVMVALKGQSIFNDVPTGTMTMAGSVVESGPSAYPLLILGTSGLVSYWRLGDASGNALDSKSSNHGTINGSPTRNVSGLISGDSNGAIQSDGAAGKYIDVPRNANMNVGAQLTVECWIRLTALPGTNFYPMYRVGSDYCWWLQVYSDGRLRWFVQDVNLVGTDIVAPAGTIVTGTVLHIVGTYDAAGTMKVYVNGVSKGTPTRTPNANVGDYISATIRMLSDYVADPSITGVQDESAFYNVALTAQQVLSHYNVGLGGVFAADTPAGTMVLSGGRTESYVPGPKIYTDACSGSLVLSGTLTESYRPPTIYIDARTGSLVLSGSAVESSSKPSIYFDKPSDILALSGSITERQAIATGTGWGGPGPVRELPPLRVHVEAITPDGKRYRWGSDEPDPQNVPTGLRFSSTMPGGYESMDCVLARKPGPQGQTADLDRLSTLLVTGPGGDIAGEYRLERTPRTSGDRMAISPSAVGWQAHLDDNKGVSIIYFDRELGGWGAMSRQRILNLLSAGYNPTGGGSVVPDTTTGVPTLDLGFDDPGSWTATTKPIVEPLYDAGPGNSIGRVRGTWAIAGATAAADANWTLACILNTKDTLDGAGNSIGDLFTGSQGSSGSIDLIATGKRRFAALQWYYAIGPAGTAGSNNRYGLNFTLLRVLGDHGLTIRGSTPQTEGLYASDIIAHAVRTWAPMLVIKEDSIQQSNFIIPQMAFRDNTTTTEIVRQATRFNLADWGVWEGREFQWYERNTRGRRWRARIAPAQFEETGLQADRLWESVIVQYNDVDGSVRTVGPPGSWTDIESALLKDIDPENPANKLGIVRRNKLVMGTSTPAGAIEVGRRFLEEQKLLDRSGRARITGHVTDDHGVMHPYWRMRAGDLISFIDANDTSYRRIVKVDHDASARTAGLDLDAPPEGLDALLERLGVVLAPLGL